MWTATAYRTDGSDLIDSTISAEYQIIRRTLMEHFKDGHCPDFNIHIKLFEHVENKDADKFRMTNDRVHIGSIDALLDGYVTQFMECPEKQTLMVIPASMSVRGREYTSAKACHLLEKKLRKAWRESGRDELCLVQLGSYDGTTLVSSSSDGTAKQCDRLKSDEHVHVVIAVNAMDEGVDWPDCCQTFLPRVPRSMVRTMQLAIGRAMRKPLNQNHGFKKYNGKHYGTSDVWFFEIGIHISHEDVIAPAVRDLAARIKCLCYGVELTEPIPLFKLSDGVRSRVDAEKTTLRAISPIVLNDLNVELNRMADAGESVDAAVDYLTTWAGDQSITLSSQAALEYLAEINVVDPVEVRKALSSKNARKFVEAHGNNDFDGLLDVIKDSLVLVGTSKVIGILTSNSLTDTEITARLLDIYPTYEEARVAAQALGIKSQLKYFKRYVEDQRLSRHPDRTYKDWVNWFHFLGNDKPESYTYEEAKVVTQALGIKSSTGYFKRYGEDSKLPSRPDKIYNSSGWINWSHFLGNRIKPESYAYDEARLRVQELGIQASDEYGNRYKEDPRLPRNPDRTYKDKGWINWFNFLGKDIKPEFYTYDEASLVTQALRIKSQSEYFKRYREDPKLPSAPGVIYKGKGWISWSHFFGKSIKPEFYTYEEAKTLKIKSHLEYRRRRDEDRKLPSSPHMAYDGKGWVSYPHFFGKDQPEFYSTYEEARLAAQALGVRSKSDYLKRYKEVRKLPCSPDKMYKGRGWVSWPHFFGKTQ